MTKKQKKLIETIEKELSGMTCCDIVDYIVNRKEDIVAKEVSYDCEDTSYEELAFEHAVDYLKMKIEKLETDLAYHSEHSVCHGNED